MSTRFSGGPSGHRISGGLCASVPGRLEDYSDSRLPCSGFGDPIKHVRCFRLRNRGVASLLAIILLTPMLAFTGCSSSSPVLASNAPARPLTIDGQIDDWQGSIRKVDKEAFSMGIQNDGQFLYVSLITIDATVASQIIHNGLEVWFDPAGGKEKVFGLRFPMGLMAAGVDPGIRMRLRARQGPGAEAMQQVLEESFAASLSLLRLLYDGEDGIELPSEGVPGIEVKSSYSLGTLVYELRIPLQRSDAFQYAVGAAPGSAIGFGLETTKVDVAGVRADVDDGDEFGRGSRRGTGAGGDGFGGTGGIDGSGGMGRGGRSGFQEPSQMKFWTNLTLNSGS